MALPRPFCDQDTEQGLWIPLLQLAGGPKARDGLSER